MSTMYTELKLKRGRKKDLPPFLPVGEPVFCYDTGELYVGMGSEEPPKLMQDNSKWFIENIIDNLGELTEETYQALCNNWNTNLLLGSSRNFVIRVFRDEPEEFSIECGRYRQTNGKMVNAFKPKIIQVIDEETGDLLKQTEIQLGTDKEPFIQIWVGKQFMDGTTGANTTTNNFLEQWGRIYAPSNAIIRIDLPFAYATPNYNLQLTTKSDNFPNVRIVTISPGAFEIQCKDFNSEIHWRTIGR